MLEQRRPDLGQQKDLDRQQHLVLYNAKNLCNGWNRLENIYEKLYLT